MRNEYPWNLDVDYLSHHGIKGQQWGKRNGPPYPLSRDDYSKAELKAAGKKKAGHVRDVVGGNNNGVVRSTTMTKKDWKDIRKLPEYKEHASYNDDFVPRNTRKDNIKYSLLAMALSNVWNVAAATVGFYNPAALGVGAYTIGVGLATIVSGEVNNAKAMKKTKRLDAEREAEPIDKKTGLHKNDKERTPDECAERINPEYKSYMTGTTNNCVACAISYDLQRRGYDARARKTDIGVDERVAVDICYSGAKVDTYEYTGSDVGRDANTLMPAVTKQQSTRLADTAQAKIQAQGANARGVVGVVWNGSNSGHAIAYENTSNGTVFYDCQSGEKFTSLDDVGEFRAINVLRTDNATLKYDKLKGFVE